MANLGIKGFRSMGVQMKLILAFLFLVVPFTFNMDHGDIEAMTAALRTLLTDNEAYEQASAEARRIADRLTWSDVTRRYAELLTQVGAGHDIAVA